MNKFDIQKILEQHPDFRDKLYCRGFLFTNDEIDEKAYPFYGLWQQQKFGKYTLLVSPKQQYHHHETENKTLIMIGHAYDPIDMIADETKILNNLAKQKGKKEFQNLFNHLTGVFVVFSLSNKGIEFIGDPVGLYSIFYTVVDKKFYIASHSNMLGDLLRLEWDPFIKKLSQYKFFHYFGNQLPGNSTQFSDVKRLVPNHIAKFNGMEIVQERFYWPHYCNITIEQSRDELISLLTSSMKLITEKWSNPAISVTGGCDSKTTLACATGLYENYKYFSYDSQLNEKPDAEAAQIICQKLNLSHQLYAIPYTDREIENIEISRVLLAWNTGDIVSNNKNDVRKRAILSTIDDFDVEVKSWVSEIGRSRYTKRYNNKRDFGIFPNARQCTTFYKVFVTSRRLVKQTDKIFDDYLKQYFDLAKNNPIPWQDQFYWEWHWPSRDGISLTGEHMYSSAITVPYNNRRILELLLSVKEEDRIKDTVYSMIREKMNPNIDKATKSIIDVNHTKKRAVVEKMYYSINTQLPF